MLLTLFMLFQYIFINYFFKYTFIKIMSIEISLDKYMTNKANSYVKYICSLIKFI